jgi:hypothetical protein
VELRELHEGYFWRQDQLRQFWSAMTAATMQPNSKKRIKPTDLYQPMKTKAPKPVINPEEQKAQFQQVVERMGTKAYPLRK